MIGVILAAGMGSRLRPITKYIPKTLVEVNDKPIISYIIEALIENGINRIVICVGYKKNKIISFCKENYPNVDFKFVVNDEYKETNNMYSLYLAQSLLKEDLILMNGDVIVDSQIIKEIIKEQHSCVAVDKDRYIEESMKIIVENKTIKHISKKIKKEEAYGSSIDVYKINKTDLEMLIHEIKYIVEIKGSKNLWTEVMLDSLFKSQKLKAYPYDIGNKKWSEIDNYNDLILARKLFKQ